MEVGVGGGPGERWEWGRVLLGLGAAPRPPPETRVTIPDGRRPCEVSKINETTTEKKN